MKIPTAISERELIALREMCYQKRVVEAGALLGFSTVNISRVAKHITSIDPHDGYKGQTYRQFMSNAEVYGFSNIEAIIGDATKILPLISADVAFFDLTGDEWLTRYAILSLHRDVETVIIHDTERAACEGVVQAIDKVSEFWEPTGQIDTLGILRRRR